MTDKWLLSFLLAADCKSFTKAANLSFISPTAIIQQINLMENELGFPLFYRYHNGIQLTEAGKSFYTTARQLQKLYEEGCGRCRDLQKADASLLRIAYAPDECPFQWLNACGGFAKANQPVSIEMKPTPMSGQLKAIQMQDADLCIIAEPAPEAMQGCAFEPLYEDCYCFCMSPSNPLAKKKRLTREDLRDSTVLCGRYAYLKQSFESGLAQSRCHIKSLETEYDMSVRMAAYMSNDIFPIHSLWSDQYTSMLTVLTSDMSAGRVGLVYRVEKKPLIMRFCDYLKNQCDLLAIPRDMDRKTSGQV